MPAVLAVIAVFVRMPTFLSTRALSFDDGVYGASVVDMRRGLLPYRELFSSQGPLHLPLLYVGDIIGLHTIDGPRVTPVLAGVAVTIAVWASARRLGARPPVALVAGVLIATTGTMLWTTGQITGDGPAAALTALAVWAALCYRDWPRLTTALLAGALFGAALATKPIVIAAVVPLGAWLACRRRTEHVVAACGAALGVWLGAALPWGLARVWQQSVEYHERTGPSYSHLFQLQKLFSTVVTRDAVILAAVLLGVVAAYRAREKASSDTIVLTIWLVLAGLVLVFERAMFANHVAAFVLPLVLLVAVRPPPLRWLALGLIILVPWELVNQRDILWPSHATGVDSQVEAALRALPAGAEAIADDPGLVWRAGRATPAQMNDTTDMRVFQGSITTRTVAVAAASPRNCAVVVTPGGWGVQLAGLRPALEADGYALAHAYRDATHARDLWLRTDCSPG